MGLLSDHLKWQKYKDSDKIPTPLRPNTEPIATEDIDLSPTTPVPAVNEEWLQMQMSMACQTRNFCYKTEPLTGFDACQTALNACKKRLGVISQTIWIPNIDMKQLWIDIPELFHIPFQGFIPYFHATGAISTGGQIIFDVKWVQVIEDMNISNGHIICMLP